jgi:hypothetical protein
MRLLKETDVYEDSIAEYNDQLRYFKQRAPKRNNLDKQKGRAGLPFLAYLQSYLKVRDFWFSWSLAGVREAAARLGVSLEEIARTNTHLESFNGRIKGKYFAHHMRGGRLPRLDYWVLIYITEVLPAFFAEWAGKRALSNYYSHMPLRPPQPLSPNSSHAAHPVPKLCPSP